MMTGPGNPIPQADRARQTIWRLFRRRQVSADVATARLLMVDLAARGRERRLQHPVDRTTRAPRTRRA